MYLDYSFTIRCFNWFR